MAINNGDKKILILEKEKLRLIRSITIANRFIKKHGLFSDYERMLKQKREAWEEKFNNKEQNKI